jgi:hypothetical protein
MYETCLKTLQSPTNTDFDREEMSQAVLARSLLILCLPISSEPRSQTRIGTIPATVELVFLSLALLETPSSQWSGAP